MKILLIIIAYALAAYSIMQLIVLGVIEVFGSVDKDKVLITSLIIISLLALLVGFSYTFWKNKN